ncbi:MULTISPECIES: NEL-type E3 ubiquitin ligase domain-containing protein [Pseudomonas]|uniref:RING-type E3 ubiquitin transferase n=1 Tax=Pseudomonas putida TaxID=303 RepID=A0A7W2QHB4_PSEPU|nr:MULTISPECIES: NEL-type E3 ubiquitin ligase domain-containing protein [Pseudomonas]MBA6114628.1 leucine-rich repeat domain-containing protein [Pseudomonas putida]MCZ9638860.1 leucine-rich repeat domain-containing protein [Pseudomonas putida]QNL87032.1 Type III secretion system effector protein [Pseudomonas putida]
MTHQPDQPPHTDCLALEQAFQDRFIAARLPQWLQAACAKPMPGLTEALRQSLTLRQQLSDVLGRLEGIDSFSTRRLEQALAAHCKQTFDVHRWSFVAGHRQPVINTQPVGIHLTEVVYGDRPLLEAALRNFTVDEAAADGQPRGNRLTSARQGTVKPPSALAFANLCRRLDLGGQYQRHLDSVLLAPTAQGHSVAALLGDAQRQQMLVDAYKARHSGVLDNDELHLIIGVCRDGVSPRLQGRPVVAKQLSLLGCKLEQIVLLDVIEAGWLRNTTRRLLAYVPGDPHGPWCVASSLRRLANDLGRRLRTRDYQRFFSRFVRRRDSQAFFSVIIPAYADLADWANYDLEEHMQALPPALFETLGTARIAQIKDDAAMIAVPVADLDRAVQEAHDQRLAAEGWALLNLAGLFIPMVGAGLLAFTAWGLLKEVFHGVEAWHEGDTRAALDHLTHVATDLAVMGATAVGVGVALRTWQRSVKVDSLLPGLVEDGSTRLCDPVLADYRASPFTQARMDEEGVHHLEGRAWVEMDGHCYPVVQGAAEGQWRLRPRGGYGPRLSHNGAGAWRLWFEQPAQWDDTYQLFRRLGGRLHELDDEQIDQVLVAHNLQADHLRALHVEGQAPDAALVDSVERFLLDRRIGVLIERLRAGQPLDDGALLQHVRALPGGQELDDQALAELAAGQRRLLFEQAYDATQPAPSAETGVLRRAFPSLQEPVARALLHNAPAADRARLTERGRVALRLAEAARLQAARVRQARVFEAFYLEVAQHVDLARVALSMLKHLPAGASVRWALFDGDAEAPLLVTDPGGLYHYGLWHEGGAFRRVDATGRALGQPGELFAVMADAYDSPQRDALGIGEPFAHNLRVLLSRQAVAHRAEVAQLLGTRRLSGWFRPPQRELDGRLGYRLSGRREGRPQALFASVRDVYPSFSDAQVLAWVEDLRTTGVDVHTEIARLNNELGALRQRLDQWVLEAAPGGLQEERRYFRRCLIDCWQRRVTVGVNNILAPQSFRFAIFAAVPGNLPELPAQVRFAHVFELALLGMQLDDIPVAFLATFPNLRILELSGNRLSRVPAAIAQMPDLNELDLFNNRIVLDPEQAGILAGCRSLQYLNLSFNPLGRGFSLRALNRLRRLHMRGTGQTELPPGVLSCPDLLQADLRDNLIATLPASYHRAPVWARRSLILWGNPLNARDLEGLPVQWPSLGQGQSALPGTTFVRQRWLDSANVLARDELSACWESLETEPGSDDFFQLLGRLLDTAEFTQNGEALAERVFTLLQAMRDHASLREALFNQVDRQLTCQDSVALCFSNLELSMLVWRARADAGVGDQQGALLHLGRQLWRLDALDRIALEDIQRRRAAGRNPDEIEVGLAYRVALRTALDLPAQPGDMLYADVSGVGPSRIEAARARVQSSETDEQVAASLVQREFWREHLERSQAARLEAADAPFHERLQALLEGAEGVPEAEYLARVAAVNNERQAARNELLLALTREALAARVTAPS